MGEDCGPSCKFETECRHAGAMIVRRRAWFQALAPDRDNPSLVRMTHDVSRGNGLWDADERRRTPIERGFSSGVRSLCSAGSLYYFAGLSIPGKIRPAAIGSATTGHRTSTDRETSRMRYSFTRLATISRGGMSGPNVTLNLISSPDTVPLY
jgi:hypothetical protein